MSGELAARHPGAETPVAGVVDLLRPLAGQVTGVTISGGEPFEQAEAVADLVELGKKIDLGDFVVYSGYTLSELQRRGAAAKRLLELADVLIDGRYLEDQPTRKLWRGSANQEVHLLSAAARERYSDLVDSEYSGPRPVQIGFDQAGRLFLVGIPERGDWERLREALHARGLRLEREGP
jgi:anaerobic ribonucleoside-triphosphate reductase activating protein